jgi:imidazolonepropionase-like amidohydrolase
MKRLLLRNANVFDSRSECLLEGRNVLVEDGHISCVETNAVPADQWIDCTGRTLLPGLIDAHVHVTAVTADFAQLERMAPTLIAARSQAVLQGMLMRGFTTVRDAGGADWGLVQAVEEGLYAGPRILASGRALSQTGGHADLRGRSGHFAGCACAGALGTLGRIADGITEVRRAARDELRRGATQIKIMASGGVASPTDPIDYCQYSRSELDAVCEETANANTYVMAHAYTPKAIVRAVQAGVRSIEHGNLLDAEAAAVMAERGAWLVPTLATYSALMRRWGDFGWSDEQRAKLERVAEKGLEAIRNAVAAGVRVGFGTDLLGAMHEEQSNEFLLRLPAMPAARILASATAHNADLLGIGDRLGAIEPGKIADLVLVNGNPLEDLGLLQEQGRHLDLIMQSGRICKNTLRIERGA